MPSIPVDWQTQLDWSPDGNRLAFGGAPINPDIVLDQVSVRDVHVLNLADGKLSALPRSRGFSLVRWSPDGRLIAAASPDLSALMLFELHSQKWRPLAKLPGEIYDTKWSRKGDYIYSLQVERPWKPGESWVVFRVRLRDGRVESVVRLDIALANRSWLGLAPDDSVVLSQSFGSDDIYSLAWHAP